MADTLYLRCYAELNDHLPANLRQQTQQLPVVDHRRLGTILGELGIPEADIDLALANGRSVDLDYRPAANDRIALFPVFEKLDISPLVTMNDRPLRRTRFILDVHLGALARKLRMLGFDTLYYTQCDDPELIAVANRDQRLLLTRDRGIMACASLERGYYVQAIRPDLQLTEVLSHFDLRRQFAPFTRCMVCNGQVVAVSKAAIKDRISDATARYFDDYFQCRVCNKIYWKGTHYQRMLSYIAGVQSTLSKLASHN